MTKTYGTIRHLDAAASGLGVPGWAVACEPHVMMRLKRIFPRAYQFRAGDLRLADSPETATDLLWIMERWPMDMTALDRLHIHDRDAAYHEHRAEQQRILEGYLPPPPEALVPACTFRDYQEQAAALAIESGALLLADDVGVGKTHSGMRVLLNPDQLPALVVTLTHLPRQWATQINTALPWLRTYVAKKGSPVAEANEADVIILNYAKLGGWADFLAGQIRTVIYDEVQEMRTGPGTMKYDAGAVICTKAKTRMGLTATPVYNYGDELWNVINLLDPDVLGTKPEFQREWGAGDKIVRDPAALGTYLRDQGIMLRRTRKDVGRQLPPQERIPQYVPIDEVELAELADADQLAEILLASDSSGQDRFLAAGDFDAAMRKATGVAKAKVVAEFTKVLLASEPVVLFGWHHDVYEIWRHELEAFRPAFYTGHESGNQKHESARRFLDGETDLLIMSLRAGAGLDGLQERAKVCVFGELDWSPGVHVQCMGRLDRDREGEPETVVGFFMIADGGCDPIMADVLNLKEQQSNPILDPNALPFEQKVDNSARMRAMAEAYLKMRRGQRR